MSKTWFFFGGSGHGSESSCQISAYYKFFPGLHVFCRISTGLDGSITYSPAEFYKYSKRPSSAVKMRSKGYDHSNLLAPQLEACSSLATDHSKKSALPLMLNCFQIGACSFLKL